MKNEAPHPDTGPLDDEREALTGILLSAAIENQRARSAWVIANGVGPHPGSPHIAQADAVLAAGFRRQGPITDAQVEAAAESLWRHDTVDEVRLAYARAALEAARGA